MFNFQLFCRRHKNFQHQRHGHLIKISELKPWLNASLNKTFPSFSTCMLTDDYKQYSFFLTCSWWNGSSDRSFMVDPLGYFLFQPVPHNWCNKDCGMCYPVCGMMHIKEHLLLIGKSSPCGGSWFSLSLYECFFNICLTPYNHK